MPRETKTAILKQKACISKVAQCYHLEFEIPEVADFPYPSGQFISTVAPDANGKSQTRAYSIASAANGNRFELCINRVENGFFSNHLCDLPVGGSVQVHGPHGNFTLREPLTDSIFVATGTGIAPMRGFTQWLFPESGEHAGEDRSNGKHIWLVYGTRYESELYYRDYFDRIAQEHDNFHYVTTLSRAQEEWAGHRGYVQEHVGSIVEARSTTSASAHLASASISGALSDTVVAVEERVITDEVALALQDTTGQNPAVPLTFDIHTYICGLNNMVSAVRDRLTDLGWHKKQIIFERYD